MELPVDITNKSASISNLCQQYDVVRLFVFGSAANGDFKTDSSDVDLMVEMDETDPTIRGEKLMALWTAFEQLFGRKVDLVSINSIRNPFFKEEIEQTKRLIYDRAG